MKKNIKHTKWEVMLKLNSKDHEMNNIGTIYGIVLPMSHFIGWMFRNLAKCRRPVICPICK